MCVQRVSERAKHSVAAETSHNGGVVLYLIRILHLHTRLLRENVFISHLLADTPEGREMASTRHRFHTVF